MNVIKMQPHNNKKLAPILFHTERCTLIGNPSCILLRLYINEAKKIISAWSCSINVETQPSITALTPVPSRLS